MKNINSAQKHLLKETQLLVHKMLSSVAGNHGQAVALRAMTLNLFCMLHVDNFGCINLNLVMVLLNWYRYLPLVLAKTTGINSNFGLNTKCNQQ